MASPKINAFAFYFANAVNLILEGFNFIIIITFAVKGFIRQKPIPQLIID